jgi:hypothetical protein
MNIRLNNIKIEFQQEFDQLSRLSKSSITDVELEAIVNKICTLGKDLIKEHSETKSLHEIADLVSEMKDKINMILEGKGGVNKGKINIIFTQKFVQPEKPLQVDQNEKVEAQEKVPFDKQDFVENITTKLKNLQVTINDVENYEMVLDHFKKESSFPERINFLCEKFINGLFNFVLNKISKSIFIGYHRNLYFDLNKKKLTKLESKIDNLNNEVKNLKNEKKELPLENSKKYLRLIIKLSF